MQSTSTYAAKYVCGVQGDTTLSAPSYPDVQPGRYSTKINVHNNAGLVVNFRKKIIPLAGPPSPVYGHEIAGGGEVPRDPKYKVIENLSEDWALEVTCKDIYGYFGIKPPVQGQAWPYMEGFVVFEVFFNSGGGKPIVPPPDPLDVVGVYTYKGDLPAMTGVPGTGSGVSIEVVVYPAKSNSHILH
jgi:hypothetical protein